MHRLMSLWTLSVAPLLLATGVFGLPYSTVSPGPNVVLGAYGEAPMEVGDRMFHDERMSVVTSQPNLVLGQFGQVPSGSDMIFQPDNIETATPPKPNLVLGLYGEVSPSDEITFQDDHITVAPSEPNVILGPDGEEPRTNEDDDDDYDDAGYDSDMESDQDELASDMPPGSDLVLGPNGVDPMMETTIDDHRGNDNDNDDNNDFSVDTPVRSGDRPAQAAMLSGTHDFVPHDKQLTPRNRLDRRDAVVVGLVERDNTVSVLGPDRGARTTTMMKTLIQTKTQVHTLTWSSTATVIFWNSTVTEDLDLPTRTPAVGGDHGNDDDDDYDDEMETEIEYVTSTVMEAWPEETGGVVVETVTVTTTEYQSEAPTSTSQSHKPKLMLAPTRHVSREGSVRR